MGVFIGMPERPAMYPSFDLCRQQAALHRKRAACEPLANVRAVAERAAIAWEKEQVVAERRERRQSADANHIVNVPEARLEPLQSENPDRGCADG